MCLAQELNAVPPVWLEPATLRSRVKHSTTEPPLLFLQLKRYELGSGFLSHGLSAIISPVILSCK